MRTLTENEKTALILADAILSAVSLSGTPNGHIYAALMPAGVTFDIYSAALDFLSRNSAIAVQNDLVKPAKNFERMKGHIAKLVGQK